MSSTHEDYASLILNSLQMTAGADELLSAPLDDSKAANAGRCMTDFIRMRLAPFGTFERMRNNLFRWKDGVITISNSRVTNYHWSTLRLKTRDVLHKMAAEIPVVYLKTHWQLDEREFHAWAIPEPILYSSAEELPVSQQKDSTTIRIHLDEHRIKSAPSCPDLSSYHVSMRVNKQIIDQLVAAIKMDDQARGSESASEEEEDQGEESVSAAVSPGFSDATVAFVRELAQHTEDGNWHTDNKIRFKTVLRGPTVALLEALRDRYIVHLLTAAQPT